MTSRSGDLSARRQFVARAAANDWDGIIMTQQAFKSIGVRAETIEAYQESLIADVRQTILNAQKEGEDRTTVKKLEIKLQAEEERMKKLMDTAPDSGLTFEDTGGYPWSAGCDESRTSGAEGGSEKRAGSNPGVALRPDPTSPGKPVNQP